MSLTFMLIAAAALVLLALSAWLILRARMPKRGPAQAAAGKAAAVQRDTPARATLGQWAERAMFALRYLSTLGEWRYQVPWFLLVGPTGTGKTSLTASIDTGRRQDLLLKERQLQVSGTGWTFFDKGILIDPDRAPKDDAALQNLHWQAILTQLMRQRPERPADGLVLVLSARTLREGNSADLEQLANDLYLKLWSVQKILEFTLPVYVLVSQCDVLDGFTGFWQAQPEPRRREIFGWSSPYPVDQAFQAAWVPECFATVSASLRNLQLETAAEGKIADPDAFFLFPQQLVGLQEPLRVVLQQVFRSAAYNAEFMLRGIYFAGSLSAAGSVQPRQRGDVAFLDELFDSKIFAERRLARPTRLGILSRNRFIRRLQLTGGAALLVLLCWLAYDGFELNRQISIAKESLELLSERQLNPLPQGTCTGRDETYDLLRNIAQIDTTFHYGAIPLSWVDTRAREQAAHLIGNRAFEKFIFPGIECQLLQRREELEDYQPAAISEDASSDVSVDTAETALDDYLDQLTTFEQMNAIYNELVSRSDYTRAGYLLTQMNQLAQYVYGQQLPKEMFTDTGEHLRALTYVRYRQMKPSTRLRNHAPELIHGMADRAHDEIEKQTLLGKQLLNKLVSADNKAEVDTRGLADWYSWVQQHWLANSPEQNPCDRMYAKLKTPLDAMVEDYGYDPAKLRGVLQDFAPDNCRNWVVTKLTGMHTAPEGVIFVDGPHGLELNDSASGEVNGFAKVMALEYMQIPARAGLECRLPLHGWNRARLAEVVGYLRAYQQFHSQQEDAGKVLPMYDMLARRHLQHVTDSVLTDAQEPADLMSVEGVVTSLSMEEAEVSQRSLEFGQEMPDLLFILNTYASLGFQSSHDQLAGCMRHYALDALSQVSGLADRSDLYSPTPPVLGADDATPHDIYALGDTAETRDYLNRQLQRVQVLTGYASPFVVFLHNTAGGADPGSITSNLQDYWSSTVAEVNRYVQFKDTSGQVTLIDGLFTKTLQSLTTQNCADSFVHYAAASYGNDLFSDRRRHAEDQASYYCSSDTAALSYDTYDTLQRDFKDDLAGRYPFGEELGVDADLATVRSFLLDYAGDKDAVQAYATAMTAQRQPSFQAFVKQLNTVADFLKPNLAADGGGQPLQLEVQFRARAASSPDSDQVVGWSLDNGSDEALYPNGPATLAWQFGQPLEAEFQWAAGSDMKPLPDPQQPDMSVEGDKVVFTTGGQWALLRMAARHKPAGGVQIDPLANNAIYLEFDVPIVPRKPAGTAAPAPKTVRLFLRIAMYGLDPKTSQKQALSVPTEFPSSAPPAQ